MLKLTRQLYSWRPEGGLFDYYERAHLNHVMAAQNPKTGGFTYMTPLMTGTERGYSTVDDDAFWCCVGSGMESPFQARRVDLLGRRAGGLIVNLYIPADASGRRNAALDARDQLSVRAGVALTLTRLVKPGRFPVALRVPAGLAGKAVVKRQRPAVDAETSDGYAVVDRRWKAGDTVSITLPLELRIEAAPGTRTRSRCSAGRWCWRPIWGRRSQMGAGRSGHGRREAARRSARGDAAKGSSIRARRGAARRSEFVPFYRQYEPPQR
jgi:DUF1680 family protein